MPNPIDASQIPAFTGNLAQLELDAAALRKDGAAIRDSAKGAHSSFQGLSAFYTAPEANQLFASTKPAADRGAELATDIGTVSKALESYATDVRPLEKRLTRLRNRAIAFEKRVADDDDWDKDGDDVALNNDLLHDVQLVIAQIQQAERVCAQKISRLVGGTNWHAFDPERGKNQKDGSYGLSLADANKHRGETPWGKPVEKGRHWYDFKGHAGAFWEGFVIDGLWEGIKGLGALASGDGDAWAGLGSVWAGTLLTTSPLGILADKALPKSGPARDWVNARKDSAKQAGKGLLAWDEWKKDPSRAAGTVTFNALTAAAGGGGGAAAKAVATGARLNTGTKIVATVGKAGAALDPATYALRAANLGLNKLPTTNATLNALKTALHSTPTTATRIPDTLPPGSIQNPTNNTWLAPNGDLYTPNGTLHQPTTNAPAELPPHTTETPTREPALTGARNTGAHGLPGTRNEDASIDAAEAGPTERTGAASDEFPPHAANDRADQTRGDETTNRTDYEPGPSERVDQWESGGRRRPRDILDDPAQTRWAQEAYDNFLKSDDAAAISRSTENASRPNGKTGFSEEEISDIKKHLFETEHLVTDVETGVTARRKFDPDPEIADAWIRLRNGHPEPEDFILLNHEINELTYLRENPGATYREAHTHANSMYNWQSEPRMPLSRREDYESE